MSEQSEFLAGVGMRNITPPLEVGILMSSARQAWAPFEGVRLPIHARAVVIESRGTRVGVAALDLLGVSGKAFGGARLFRVSIASSARRSVFPHEMILTATHSHSAPETMALTDVYKTEPFKRWRRVLAQRIGEAFREAVGSLRPCRVAFGTTRATGLSLNRRNRESGTMDESVNLLAFHSCDDKPIVFIVNATCHPVLEMCIPQISPDYPGEMSLELERRHPGATALFLNGATGDINPTTVSSGAEVAACHGRRLADAVDEILDNPTPVEGHELRLERHRVSLPVRTAKGRPVRDPLQTTIAALRCGNAAVTFLPGEPFCETGLAIREASPFPFTAIVGYAEDSIGYIPTEQAFAAGGYETGPGLWSLVSRGSEPIVRRESIGLLHRLWSGVAEE